MFCILKSFGTNTDGTVIRTRWLLPHKTPDFGPFNTFELAKAELDRYPKEWGDDPELYAIFALAIVK
jgi:hypothetical protein